MTNRGQAFVADLVRNVIRKISVGLILVLATSVLEVAECNNTKLPLKLQFINVACVAEKLQELKEKEKEAEYFTKMPSKHYMEISSLLFSRYIMNRGHHMDAL